MSNANVMLFECIEDAILVIAGNSVTQTGKTNLATVQKLFYSELRSYIVSSRFNIDCRDQIIARKNFFHHFVLVPVDDALQQKLLAKYPAVCPPDKQCATLWDRFKKIQKAARNIFLPEYTKRFTKSPPKSGTYTSPDEPALMAIWEFARCEKIQENADKVKVN